MKMNIINKIQNLHMIILILKLNKCLDFKIKKHLILVNNLLKMLKDHHVKLNLIMKFFKHT